MNYTIAVTSTSAVTIEASDVHKKLVLIKVLFDALHKDGIRYCHWKSNEHLSASMNADTDLDVLFDEQQKDKIFTILHFLGFKQFETIEQKKYHDIVDFIGLDYPSGKIIHLHTHFRLTLGEAYLKSYQLDIEENIIQSRVYDEEYELYRINPSFELILLYFRFALKLRNRDILRLYLNGSSKMPEHVLREYKWLKERSSTQEIQQILSSLFVNYHDIYKLVTGGFDKRELLKLSHILNTEFKRYRLISPLHATLLRWYREIYLKFHNKLSKFSDARLITKRFHPTRGLVVAIIGADGSGKSTVISDLHSTFKKKVDVYSIYFGKGKTKRSWLRQLLRNGKKIIAPQGRINKSKEDLKISENIKKQKISFFHCVDALIVASEKKARLGHMRSACNKGMLVICDRFPQSQVIGYNDGPVLSSLSKSKASFLRFLAKKECHVYDMASLNPPDLVFKLIADAEVLKKRKPEIAPLDQITEKVEGIKALQFAAGCRVVTIDASQPLESVLFTIKKTIWETWQ